MGNLRQKYNEEEWEELMDLCKKNLEKGEDRTQFNPGMWNPGLTETKKEIMKEETESKIGKKETEGKSSLEEINWRFICKMSDRMDANKDKYPKDNWKKVMNYKQLVSATMRHCMKILEPELFPEDTETVDDHLAAIGCNAQMAEYLFNQESINIDSPKRTKL